MKLTVLLWILSVMLSITMGGVIAWNIVIPTSEVRISEEQVQSLLTDQLPLTSAGMEVEDAEVRFVNNLVTTTATLKTKEFMGYTYTFQVNAEGRPRYESREGAFYVDPVSVGIVTELIVSNSAMQEELWCAVKPFLPITEDAEEGAKQVLTKLDQTVRAFARGLVISSLTKTPVYTLPNDLIGGSASVFLEAVSVENGAIVFKVTLMRLLSFILFVSLGVLASCMFLLVTIRKPLPFVAVGILCFFGL